ncbi:MAG: GDP-mannose 4,6-dehydratase [Planctomycetaceae bacterium]|jgi:GDP-4-dehydro-6-deoxy-D-mannose reductase|nr:GDP-mannose 4,6-dehydratase [Planctomycetaceae bacterium]
MKKCLITGVGGFVGGHLLNYFDTASNSPAEILGLDCHSEPPILTFHRFSFRFESVDLTKPEPLATLISEFKPDALIHLAAMSSVAASWQNPAACMSNNVGILHNLLESMRRFSTLKFRLLAVGSSEVYGNAAGETMPLEESRSCQPINPYGQSRLAQEQLIRSSIEKDALDIVSTRSFSHTGPGQSERFVIASFVRQLLEAKRNGCDKPVIKTGNIHLIRDFLDVRDVVRAYHLLLEKGKAGEVYNVCRGEGVSLLNVIEMISKILELETTIEMVPALLRPNDAPVVVGNAEKLRRATGWTPLIPLEQTLRDMIRS